jgi:hypothetical protein
MKARRFAAYWLVAILCLISGCIFSPKKKPPTVTPPPDYPQLINPFTVLDALELAYGAKDSNEIKLLYHRDYAGKSTDQSDQSVLNFTKAEEVEHVAALARHATIKVTLKFPPSKSRYSDLADPPEWATIQMTQGVNVQIDDSPTSYYLTTGVITEFKLIPKTPDASSSTDTTWQIIRWNEFH